MSFQIRQIRKERRPLLVWKKIAVAALVVSKPFLGWYRSWKKRTQEEEKRQRRIHLLKRALAVLIAVLFATAIFAGIAKAVFSINFSLRGLVSLAGAELPVDTHGYTNFLLVGSGDDDHDGTDLLDTIMVASLDTADTKSVALLSIPRDLYLLNTEKMGRGRINSVYRDYKSALVRRGIPVADASIEALRELSREVSRYVDLEIHHVIKVNFSGFEEAIDALGGIEIDVPERLHDTEYPGPNYSYVTFTVEPGLQTMDGATALKYARSRHSTSDFSRSERQQRILIAAGEKAKQLKLHKDIGKITDLYAIVSQNIETTATMGELITLAGIADDFDRSRILMMQLSDRNGLYGGFIEPGGFLYAPPRDQFQGASVLLPVSIPEFPVTWRQLQTLSAVFFRERTMHLPAPRVAVLNAGAPSGAARLLGGELYRYGFDVVRIANFDGSNQDTSFLAARPVPEDMEGLEEPNPHAIAFFERTFGFPLLPFPAGTHLEDRPDIVIVVGRDYRYRPLQDLVE